MKNDRKSRRKSSSKRRVSILTNPSEKQNSEHLKQAELSSNMDRIQDDSLLSEMVKAESKLYVRKRSTNSDDKLQVLEDGSVSMQSPKFRMSSRKKIAQFNMNQQCFDQSVGEKEKSKNNAVIGGFTIEDNVSDMPQSNTRL